MKRILINATQEEELRVAIADGQKLMDMDIETPSAGHKKGNIYKGVISRIEPGLDAVFVDYGDPKHGFLPFREISQAYFRNKTAGDRNHSQAIAKSLRQGQALLVQVQREGHGGKGAALTTFISLAGRYLVLMPNNPRAGGVSRRADDKDRDVTRQILSQLDLHNEEGAIIRTRGIGCEIKLLQRDLDYLRSLWNSIVSSAKGSAAPFLVYEESNVVICALRDHLSDDTEEIIVDTEKIFDDARNFIKLTTPQHLSRLKLHQGPVPLFNHYHIESQIETAFDREITLNSGGSVVFDRTEALLSIDINSGKATRGSNIEETALNTNLEAAEEIARQLRLRDLGGLIVIDFIDMASVSNRKTVENHLHRLMSQDKARVQFERISRFGLLEMSRQRLRPSLSESSHLLCPRCNGKGFIRTLESSALSTLRMMEEEAIKEKSGRVVAQLPIEMSSFLLNEKRETINEIEHRHNVQLVIVPDAQMQIPHFQIRRYRADDKENLSKYSYEMVTARKPALTHVRTNASGREKPAVGPVMDFISNGKTPGEPRKHNWLSAITSLFQKKKAPRAATTDKNTENDRRQRRRGGRRRSGRGQERRQFPEQQYNRSATPERGTGRPSTTAGGSADTRPPRGSGRSRRGRPATKRRPQEYGTRATTQTVSPDAARTTARATARTATQTADAKHPTHERRRDERKTTTPYADSRPDSHTSSSGTVFTPPMPIIPDAPPQTGGGEYTTDSPKPVLPSTPSATEPAAPVARTDHEYPATTPSAAMPTVAKTEAPSADKDPVQTVPYSPPRFSKPSNLTQVETKNTLPDEAEPGQD